MNPAAGPGCLEMGRSFFGKTRQVRALWRGKTKQSGDCIVVVLEHPLQCRVIKYVPVSTCTWPGL